MAGLFESVRQAICLMLALPFALAGAFWALWLTGTDFDQPAAVGLLFRKVAGTSTMLRSEFPPGHSSNRLLIVFRWHVISWRDIP
ncbi:MAG: efflux RND transporter permease subunit [bacterium]|nr:efflux RND transporter permease subunit [bacterium]